MFENYATLENEDLAVVIGGGPIGDAIGGAGEFVGQAWDTLYESGKDFGRNIYNGWFK